MFANLVQGIKELVFPDNCWVCRAYLNSRHERQLCPACLDSIPRNVPPFCGLCSRHLEQYSDDGLCASCRGQTRYYDRAWGACLYDEPMRQLIHAFKYNGKTALRKTFLNLMREHIDTYHVPLSQFDITAPIPLHAARLRERGFNQAGILSDALCRHYQMAHCADLLWRARPTETQTALDQKQRWTNLQGAFKMNLSKAVTAKSVLLVDDLLTTGATIDAASACLKKAGASYVGVLTLAITK